MTTLLARNFVDKELCWQCVLLAIFLLATRRVGNVLCWQCAKLAICYVGAILYTGRPHSMQNPFLVTAYFLYTVLNHYLL